MAAGKAKTKHDEDGKRAKEDPGDGEVAARVKGSTLVVVESPAKDRAIRSTGARLRSEASVGHVMVPAEEQDRRGHRERLRAVLRVIEAIEKVVATQGGGEDGGAPAAGHRPGPRGEAIRLARLRAAEADRRSRRSGFLFVRSG